jgi:hypothetical protein
MIVSVESRAGDRYGTLGEERELITSPTSWIFLTAGY